MQRKRKPPKPPTMEDVVKMLDKIPPEEATKLVQPYAGLLVKVMQGLRKDQKTGAASRREAEDLIKRTRAWITQLRDSGVAPKDLAKMYGMSERELRAFLAGEADETH